MDTPPIRDRAHFHPDEPAGIAALSRIPPTYPADWLVRPFLSFDLETTGVDPETARIVTWSAALVGYDESPTITDGVVRPDGFEIPVEASNVHGWTTEKALAHKGAKDRLDALQDITRVVMNAELGAIPIVIYNAPYDITVTLRELARLNMPAPRALIEGPIIDPLVLDKRHIRKGKRTLSAVCEHHGVKLDDAHDASADALAAAELARSIVSRDLALAGMELPELHELQREAFAAQAANFEGYLRRKRGDSTIEISREWPYRRSA